MSTASPAEPVTTFENANGTTENKSTLSLPKAKLSALNRFKALTNGAFGSSSSSSSDGSPSFPPDSWSLSQAPDTGTGASSWTSDVERWRQELERWKTGLGSSSTPATPGTTVSNQPDDVEESGSKGKDKAEDTGDGDGKDVSESSTSTLAMRIKAIIDENINFSSASKTPAKAESRSEPSTPGPSGSSASQSNTPSGSLTPKTETDATTPATSNGSMFNFAIDSKLAKLLSSETIMSGGAEKGKESVWAILDRLGYGRKDEKGKDKDVGSHNEIEEDGIMFYSPLQPTMELSPEIAESVISEDDSVASPRHSIIPNPKSPLSQPPILGEPPDEPETPKPKQKRVFQPSATKLSFQCTWWGYRLFLPPAVMAQLSNAHIAAAKRGAMITAALKWIVDKAPVMMVPPQLRPAMLLLRSFSPYLGYVGAFVAWSWTRVESKDVGNGVVLTATWLLPIAIVPSSWDFETHGTPVDPDASTREAPSQGAVASASSSGATTKRAEGESSKDGAPSTVPHGTSTGVSTGKGKEPVRNDSTDPAVTRREPRINRTTSAPASSGAGVKERSQPSQTPSLTRSTSSRDTPGEEATTPRPSRIKATTSTESTTSGKSSSGRTLRTPWGRVRVKDESQRTKSAKSTLRNLPSVNDGFESRA